MKAYCLASSSAGNCFALIFGDEAKRSAVMVECGLAPTEILKRLCMNSIGVDEIGACLITHSHGDHAKSAKSVERWGIPIFATKETVKAIGSKDAKIMKPYAPRKIAEGVSAMAFPVDHDAEGSAGFVIKGFGECAIFVNDCKGWDADLSEFSPDFVFIECNYWERHVRAEMATLRKELRDPDANEGERIQAATKLKQNERVVAAHMSLAGCIKSLKTLDLSRCRSIFLMHLSDRTANEYEMKTAVEKATGVRTRVCKKGGGIK